MLRSGLDASLRGIREHAAGNTQTDLRTDDAGVRGCACAAAEVDEQAEGDHKKTCSKEDEGLETSHFEDDESESKTCENGREAVEGADASGALDRFVESDDEDGVEEVALHVPCYRSLVKAQFKH